MRFLCFLFLVALAGAVGIFAWQNEDGVTIRFPDWTLPMTLAAVAGASYVVGMFSGWSIVGMIRRSVHRVTDRPTVVERRYANAHRA